MIIQLYDTSHNRRMIKPKKSSGKKRKKREIIADLKIGNESATADIKPDFEQGLLEINYIPFLGESRKLLLSPRDGIDFLQKEGFLFSNFQKPDVNGSIACAYAMQTIKNSAIYIERNEYAKLN